MLRDMKSSCMEMISGGVTNPGSTLTAVTMTSPNSNQVRPGNGNPCGQLMWLSTYHNVAGDLEVYASRMHDAAQGMRFKRIVTDTVPIFLSDVPQLMFPFDNISYLLSGSGSAVSDVFSGMIFYDDYPGSKARLADLETIQRYGGQFVTIRTAITGSGTSPSAYVGAVRLNTISNTLYADFDYAWIGYGVDTETPAIRITGPAFANLGLGGPGSVKHLELTRNWFIELYKKFGKPCIPVFNANDLGQMSLDILNATNTVSPVVDLLFCRLDPMAKQVV